MNRTRSDGSCGRLGRGSAGVRSDDFGEAVLITDQANVETVLPDARGERTWSTDGLELSDSL